MKKSGIYRIINLVNNKVYIGLSKDLDKRWKTHTNELRKNRHYNTYLQSSWNKYKEENFKFDILEFCSNEELVRRESYWINFYESYIANKGYNIIHENYKIVERIKKNNGNKVCSKIYQVDLNNKLVNIFESISDAALHVNIDAHQLGKKLWGNKASKNSLVNSYKGYCWVKEQDYEEGKEYHPKVFTRNRIGDKRVLFLTKQQVEEFIDIKTLAKEKNISLDRCYTRVRYNSIEDGSIIMWKDNYDENKNYFEKEKVIKYKFKHNETGEIIEMESINSEAIKYKLNPLKLYCLIKGKKKNKKGEYVDYSNYNGWGLFI